MVQRSTPSNCDVVNGSTPVVAFGNFQTARIATLGINPSNLEFLDGKGNLLSEEKQRLATLPSIGATTTDKLNHTQVIDIIDSCNSYFQRNPYMSWFKDLEKVLNRGFNASYLSGSACHLDLSQWATSSKWSSLSPIARQTLLDDGVSHLNWQLNSSNITHVVVNGISVWNEIKRSGIAEFNDVQKITFGKNNTSATLRIGKSADTVFMGWTTNIQSGHGSNANEFLVRLGNWLKETA